MADKKILAVDDSVSIRKSISFVLSQEGYEVVEAVDGADGLEKAKSAKFNLVITDINMPNIDGIEFIKQLRTMEGYKFTPIIALTTESQDSKMQEGKQAGATGWIVKPFTSEKLLAIVKKIVG
ncbi:response regulator [Treponema sp.]|uniref:response regulator n=1 Tax=Treponema sp. TaxID=166 RepID=UPI00298DD116|nr:response regulator [Treponema sp.]MCR5612745.1 response regulator [Treponema sp.]